MRHLVHYTFLLFLLCSGLYGQTQQHGGNGYSLGGQVHYGSFITSVSRAAFIKDSYSSLAELSFTKQTDGSKDWQIFNGLPSWGFIAFGGNSGSKTYIGNIGGILTFIEFKAVKAGWFISSLRPAIGLGFVQKPFDISSNHKNLLLSTKVNCALNLLWKNEFRVAKNLYINGGLSFFHLSNAAFKLPNLGLNIPSFSAGVRYSIGHEAVATKRKLTEIDKRWKPAVLLAAGIKQSPGIGGNQFVVNVATLEMNRRFNGFGKYGAGIFLSYDRSAGDHYADPLLQSKEILNQRFNPAAYIAYEQLLGKFSIPIQAGVYFQNSYASPVYQSFGIRYHMDQHWHAQATLKTHFGKADYMHLGFGYQF